MPYAAYTVNPARKLETDIKKVISPSLIKRMIIVNHNGADTTLTDKMGNGNLNTSKNASSLDPFVSSKSRCIDLNASDEWYDFNDADDLSFGNAGTDTPYSMMICCRPNNVTDVQAFYTKEAPDNGEYSTYFYNGAVYCYFLSGGNYMGRGTASSYASDVNGFHTYAVTYDGSKTNSGIKIYRDSSQVDNSNNSGGSYAGMTSGTSKAGNYYTNGSGKQAIASLKLSSLLVFSKELSSSEISSIDTLLRKYVGVI